MFLEDYDPTKNRGRWGATPLDLITDPNVSDGAFRLYAYLAAMNMATNEPPLREQIAGDLMITPTSVTNRVKELVARDWVIAWRFFRNDMHSNAYQTFNNTEECREYRRTHTNVRYVDFAGEIERRKIRRGSRSTPAPMSNQMEDQTGRMINPDGLTQQSIAPSSLIQPDQTSLTPLYMESDSFPQTLEESVDNPDLNDSVADATGGNVSQEEPDLTFQPHKRTDPVSDPTPSLDEDPLTPVPPRPSSHAAGAPEGYEFRYASGSSGRTVHLVKLGATEAMCGKSTVALLDAPKEGRSYNMCPLCMAKKSPSPRVDQPIRDAVAQHVQEFEPTMATDLTGVLASVAIAVWTRKLGRKLSGSEYEGAARSVVAFAADWRKRNPTADMPTGKQSFENHFTKFVSNATSAATEQKGADYGSSTQAAEPDRYSKNSAVFKLPSKK
ncbi:MAG: hypothetical protein KF716_08640 [Anaerolineae bacterium]|nr:hypothetical protein [Anaerolineae bacterium]